MWELKFALWGYSLNILSMAVKGFLAALVLTCSFPLMARELSDFQVEILTQQTGPEARQEAFEKATEQATRQLAEDVIGADRVAKIWPQMAPKVLRQSTRYVLFIKGSAPQQQPDGVKIQVQMRLSPDNLEALLREVGAVAVGSVRLLPLVHISEPKGSRYFWWAEMAPDSKSATQAQEYFKKLLLALGSQLKEKNIYMLDPSSASFRMGVPSAYRLELLRREDQVLLGQYLKADVVLTGQVEVVKPRPDSPDSRIDVNLQLWHTRSGRVIAEFSKSEPVSGDVPKVIAAAMDQMYGKAFKEISAKLSDAVAAGNLNLNVVRVTVVGSLNYKQQADFKRLLGNVRDVRVLKERLFEPSRVTFEAETVVNAAELANHILKGSFPQYKVDLDSVQDDRLVLSVRPLSSTR